MSTIDKFIIPPARDLPEGAKFVVLAGEVYGTYRAVKFLNSKFNKNSQENVNKDALKLNKTDADEILKNNLHLPPEQQILPSFTKAQYKDFAQTLFVAMDGGNTDEDAVHDVFTKMKNDLDVLNLIDAFGTRAGTSIFASSTATNLADWLASDGVTKLVNDILDTKKSITRRF